MFMRRVPALLTGLVVLAGSLSVAPATAAPSANSVSSQRLAAKPKVVGQPPRNYVVPSGARFSFPNRSKAEKLAIRNSVLLTVQSVWGGPRDANRLPLPSNGKIRIATWSFADMTMAKALYAAHQRGVSVQLVAAAGRNTDNRAWNWLKRRLGTAYYKAGVSGSSDLVSFARECRGSCRYRGGTPHSKFFLFDNVGSAHARHIVMQSSMNLTTFGYQGQWNSAQVVRSSYVYDSFMRIYAEMRFNTVNSAPYRVYTTGDVTSIFFPLPGANETNDPVMGMLNQVTCRGVRGDAQARTRIRVINYAIYDTRGTWIAKKLRQLWDAGCDVKVIYSLATRPVLSVLRSSSGRGPIPVKQSVILNGDREIVKYNHNKYLTIAGVYGTNTNAWMTMSGSSNWSNAGFTSDEQMQQISGYGTARAYMANFDKTWAQKTSVAPTYASMAQARYAADEQPAFGKGALKYLTPYGD